MSETVRVASEDRVATVTVDRPDKRNAMDIPTRRQLRTALERVAADDDVQVVVLEGAGDETFVTGGDIASFEEFDRVDGCGISPNTPGAVRIRGVAVEADCRGRGRPRSRWPHGARDGLRRPAGDAR